MFSDARNVLITGGTFIEQHHVHHHAHIASNLNDPGQQGWELLGRSIARGAFHNSADRYDPPKCHPGAREAVLNKILNWLQNGDNSHSFMWMYGPAGSGKSAIAQTLAEKCHKASILAASFFFSRTVQDRNSDKFLISTLSYQMCTFIPQMRQYVGEVIYQDPSVLARSLDAQMEELIVRPLNRILQDEEIAASIKSHVNFIIIDGLDECGDGKSQRRILNTLSTSLRQLKLPIFCLVASRPEHHIQAGFNSKMMRSVTIGLALDDRYGADEDIRTFLVAKFAEIREDHPLGAYFADTWPDEDQLDKLVIKASGQFIYASTIIKYIESHRHRPDDRLVTILSLSSIENDTPFAELDALYSRVLSSVENIDIVSEILEFLILTAQLNFWAIRLETSSFIETLFCYKPGDVSVALVDMHSLLSLMGDGADLNLYLHHASLGDFLLDASRSREFFVDAEQGHASLAQRWVVYISGIQNHAGWVFQYLLGHCAHAHLTPALLNALQDLKLSAHFATLRTESMILSSLPAYWHVYLRWLKSQCDSSANGERIYQSQVNDCRDWVRARLLKYPVEIRRNLAAAFTFQEFSAPRANSLMIILTHNMSDSQIEEILSLDKEAVYFSFKRPPNHIMKSDWVIISDFVSDPSSAGDECVIETRYSDLASKIVEFLFEMPPQEETTEPTRYDGYFGEVLDLPEEVALKLLALVLPKASREADLAERLRTHAFQFAQSSSFFASREILSTAALQYVQSICRST